MMRAASLGALLVCVTSSASAETPVDAVLRALGAADAARATLATEQSEATLDAQRTAALVSTLRSEARRYAALAERDAARAATIEAEGEAAEAEAALDALRREADAAAARIEARLAALDPRGEGAREAVEPDARLRRALAELRAAEQSAARIEVSIETGRLGDETIAAQVLRVGWAAAWWRALDGSAGGVVEGGVFRALDAAGAQRVAEAIAVASHQRPPALVVLPMPAAE